MNDLDVTGLGLDVAGAMLLAWGIAFGSAERYTSTAGTWYTPAIDLAHAAEGTRAIVGVALLVVGFSFQALDALGVGGDSGWWFTGLVLIPVAFPAMRQVRIKQEKRIMLARLRNRARSRGKTDVFAQVLQEWSDAHHARGKHLRSDDQEAEDHVASIYGESFRTRLRGAVPRAQHGG